VVILALASAGASLWLAGDHEARALYGTDTRAYQLLAGAMLAALVRRLRTGRGGVLDVPMYDTLAGFVLLVITLLLIWLLNRVFGLDRLFAR
jgi:crotonobetainyl-CoA:carnitine CoA-transferase CaiB-like acyl-CoA transferase